MIYQQDIEFLRDSEIEDCALLFYPGDCLQDIVLLNAQQTAIYLNILCLQLKKICFTKSELMKLMKGLTKDDRQGLLDQLTRLKDQYFIGWVMNSMLKRRRYSLSAIKKQKRKKEKRSTLSSDNKNR